MKFFFGVQSQSSESNWVDKTSATRLPRPMRTPSWRRPPPRLSRRVAGLPVAAALASPAATAPRAAPSPGLALEAVDAHVSFGNKEVGQAV